tara:strand:- start:29 stop:481 length:453 start_codon:yes stop_codon:yes gene_type:complete
MNIFLYISIFFLFLLNISAKEVSIDIFFINKGGTNKVMKFGEILTYRQTEGTASWSDSEGDYGLLECMGNYVTNNSDGTILNNYCKGTNRNKDIFWLIMNRNSSDYEAGVGRIKYLHGTGKFKKYKNLECIYGVEIIEGMAVLKQKCVID